MWIGVSANENCDFRKSNGYPLDYEGWSGDEPKCSSGQGSSDLPRLQLSLVSILISLWIPVQTLNLNAFSSVHWQMRIIGKLETVIQKKHLHVK